MDVYTYVILGVGVLALTGIVYFFWPKARKPADAPVVAQMPPAEEAHKRSHHGAHKKHG